MTRIGLEASDLQTSVDQATQAQGVHGYFDWFNKKAILLVITVF
jgi:hypothetical protein